MDAEGTPEERKAFVHAFVPEILLHPHERLAVVRIRRFPLPNDVDNGNSSFILIAGVRSELEKKIYGPQETGQVTRYELEKKDLDAADEIDELLRVVFAPERASLVPA